MNIADRIQCLRKNKGLSQEELADKVGVSRQAVSKWESEQSTPDIEKIIIMSELFEVTTDYILKGIEPVSMTNKKTMYSLYLGFALIFATIAGHEFQKDLEARMLSLVLNIGEIAGRKIHLVTYFIAGFFLSCPRCLDCRPIRAKVNFLYWSFCHIHSPKYILLFLFSLGYAYTVPLCSQNNS